MSAFTTWLEATRPKTLPAAVAPVLLGSAMAYSMDGFHALPAVICLVFALLVQIGTNFANDYLDARSGADTLDRIGPTRAVAAGLVAPRTMRNAALGVLVAAFLVGSGLIVFGGWWLLWVGIASVLCAWLYTGGPFPLAYNGLGDLFVVLFFGFIAVGCTFYVQAGFITADVLLLGLGCGLLVNNILVVNNYRDVEQDAVAGKRTLVVRLGRRYAVVQYALSTLIAAAVVVWFWGRGYGPWVLLALVPVLVSGAQATRLPHLAGGPAFLSALKASGLVVAAYGVLLALGLVLG